MEIDPESMAHAVGYLTAHYMVMTLGKIKSTHWSTFCAYHTSCRREFEETEEILFEWMCSRRE